MYINNFPFDFISILFVNVINGFFYNILIFIIIFQFINTLGSKKKKKEHREKKVFKVLRLQTVLG